MAKSAKIVSMLTIFMMALGCLCVSMKSSATAEAAESDTFLLYFGEGKAQGKSERLYSDRSVLSESFTFIPIPGGKRIKDWHVAINGIPIGKAGELAGGELKLSHVAGKEKVVIGRSYTNPGHHISRDSAGQRWRHQGEKTDNIEFIPASSTFVNGISDAPGAIPATGFSLTKGLLISSYPADLRYFDGSAVTRSYEAEPPEYFYPMGTDLDHGTTGIQQIHAKDIIPSSISIVNAATADVAGSIPFSWGASAATGKGTVAIKRMLDNKNDFETVFAGSGPQNFAVTRNYSMPAYTYWKGTTYEYAGTITVAYEPIERPDFTGISLQPANSCIQINVPTSFTLAFGNQGSGFSGTIRAEVRADGQIIRGYSYSGLSSGEQVTESFPYTFSSNAPKSFIVSIDSEELDDDAAHVAQFTFTPGASSCNGEPETITGDFHFDAPKIDFGETNGIHPDQVAVRGGNGCQIAKFGWVISQGTSIEDTFQTASSPSAYYFTGPPYPKGMGSGTVSVTMRIQSTCGTTRMIGPKFFEIVAQPNHPPVFQGGWFAGGSTYAYPPIHQVVVGSYVDLGIIHDPTSIPKTPYDPDGDGIIYDWDFAGSPSAWIRSCFAGRFYRSDEYFSMIQATEAGTHTVYVAARDTKGTMALPRPVTLQVVAPNPIPVIDAPDFAIENRPVVPQISGGRSYSPAGRAIHQYLWTNRKDVYTQSGEEIVRLDVVDSEGMHALSAATKVITIKPDLPPAIAFSYSSVMSRSQPRRFQNQSTSPDGDTIIEMRVSYGYDRENNGACVADTIISETAEWFEFQPPHVGRYCFKVYAKEDFGKDSYREYSVHVLNDHPNAAFTVSGHLTEPEEVYSRTMSVGQFLGEGWVNTSLDTPTVTNGWVQTSSGTLGHIPDMSSGRLSFFTNNREASYSFPHQSNFTFTGNPRMPDGVDPSWARPSVIRYLGNGTMIIFHKPAHNKGEIDIYVVSPHFHPILLENVRPAIYIRDDLDEAIVTSTYYYDSGCIDEVETGFSKYKLSDLKNGLKKMVDSKLFKIRSNRCYGGTVQTGTQMTFKDGSGITAGNSKIKFPDAVREYDFTSRTITTFTYDKPASVVKQESYSHIPSCGYYDGTEAYTSNHVNVQDRHGNLYYSCGRMLLQINGITGSLQMLANDPRLQNKAFQPNTDFTLLQFGTHSYEIVYFDIVRQSVVNAVPAGYDADFSGYVSPLAVAGTKDGYNYADNWIVSDKSKQRLFELPAGSGDNGFLPIRLSDSEFLTKTGIYRFIPDKRQPPDSNEGKTYGQLYNSNQSLRDGALAYSLKFNELYSDFCSAGFSFRIQDHKNMYRLEASRASLLLVKIVNGRKTAIGEVTRPLSANRWNDFKIKLQGSNIKIYENQSLMVDVTDSAFADGAFGPYSDLDTVEFTHIFILQKEEKQGRTTNGYALVGAQVEYIARYDDPEHDPQVEARSEWNITHTDSKMFLDNGDGASGISVLHGTIGRVPPDKFDKVGSYQLDYRIPDDPQPEFPYPSQVFAAYSKYSEFYSQSIIVHRAPAAIFSVHILSDGTLSYTDSSYDPDRCSITLACQEAYTHNHGIFQKKYFYVTPDGKMMQGVLLNPQEIGTYTVGEAVADEFGAWSDWFEAEVSVTMPAKPNHRPHASLVFPDGTAENPTYLSSFQPTISWKQHDPDENAVFELFDIQISDERGNLVIERLGMVQHTTSLTHEWTVDQALGAGEKYQVRIRVSDGQDYSAWSEAGWMMTNRPPAAYMAFPWGTQSAPTVFSTMQPLFQWTQSDPDAHTVFRSFQLQIWDESGSVNLLDTGQLAQSTASAHGEWKGSIALPTGKKLRVRIRVFDGLAWSPWSSDAWMLLNRPPSADFSCRPTPLWEGDWGRCESTSIDDDEDELTYEWEVRTPIDIIERFEHPAFPYLFDSPGSYEIALTVSDGFAADTCIKTVEAGALTIASEVSHTEMWADYHRAREHNISFPPKDFYSGELLVVSAKSSAAPVTEALASIDTTGRDGHRIFITETLKPSGSPMVFTGQLFDAQLQSLTSGLPVGLHFIHFEIRYTNGIVKTENVPIHIIGDVRKAAGVHRVQ